MTIAAAIAGLVRALAAGADADHITPALLLLSESLVNFGEPTLIESEMARLVELEHKLAGYPAGDRARAIQERTGWSRTTYYRRRADAIQLGKI